MNGNYFKNKVSFQRNYPGKKANFKNIMKQLLVLAVLISACTPSRISSGPGSGNYGFNNPEPPIQVSLFDDINASISEENIQKILDGKYALPEDLRVSIVKLDGTQKQFSQYWANEDFLKSQQAYLDLFSEKLKSSSRVKKVSIIPDILVSNAPSFTTIREAAVRMQSDIVLVYTINSDIYTAYRLFTRAEIKAFATTQIIVLDVRTGLVPFSAIVTKDYQSSKLNSEVSDTEASTRIKNQAILLTIEDIGTQLKDYFSKK